MCEQSAAFLNGAVREIVRLAAGELCGARWQVQLRNADFLNRTDEPPAPAAVVWRGRDQRNGVVHALAIDHVAQPERGCAVSIDRRAKSDGGDYFGTRSPRQ
jgi:hypothetical protein